MNVDDRQRWNQKYARGDHASAHPSPLVVSTRPWLPATGRALDLAGGAGRHALWFSALGLEVTLADVSDNALEIAEHRARERGLPINTVRVDLLQQPVPTGPWDVILSVHFLYRPLFGVLPNYLADGGVLVVLQPTRSNLLRHAKPPAEFLLEDGELPQLIAGLQIEHYREGWLEEGRHDALIVARKTK